MLRREIKPKFVPQVVSYCFLLFTCLLYLSTNFSSFYALCSRSLFSTVFFFFFFKKNPEDVSNFDEEFTRELPRFSCAKNKRQITETDQLLFKDFDFSSIVD